MPFVLLCSSSPSLVGGVLYLQSDAGGPTTHEFGGDLQQTLDDLRSAICDNTR